MSRFMDDVTGTFVGRSDRGREVFRLEKPLRLEIGSIWSGVIVYVPQGFETDFASVPRFFWRIVPPIGPYGPAAVVHDYLYRTKAKVTRRLADAIFYEGMAALDVPLWKRLFMFWAVRLCGGWSFNSR